MKALALNSKDILANLLSECQQLKAQQKGNSTDKEEEQENDSSSKTSSSGSTEIDGEEEQEIEEVECVEERLSREIEVNMS